MTRSLKKRLKAGHQAPSSSFYLSGDGYVRLTLEVLRATRWMHLVSGLDEVDAMQHQEGAVLSSLSGYTEWVSLTTPVLTIGWDWQLDLVYGRHRYTRLGKPRSNIMLVDIKQRDLGWDDTSTLISREIDAMDWWKEAQNHIRARYR